MSSGLSEFFREFQKKSIRNALPFGITGIFVTIYFWIDSVMLFYMQGNAAVGIYTLAYKLLLVLLSIYSVYMVAIFPVMTKLHENSPKSLKIAYENSLKYFLIIGIPLAIIITIMANDIILLVYKKYSFIPAVIPLQILVWATAFMFINGLATNLLNSIGNQVTVTKITGIGAIFNISLNIILIPFLSYTGASIATVLTEILIAILFLHSISLTKYSSNKKLIRNIWRIIIPNIILIIILITNNASLFILPIAIALYILGLYITNAINNEDIKLIKSIIK